ncbi:MAG TPA: hydrogen gas-evolving membrane-bound hydrogenase subunit E [Acidimicrobiia bacterium]|nr:hydrogen gas-evolving membrane-bound hydrogenase subunit E [Acidimicrobiia bacterium]
MIVVLLIHVVVAALVMVLGRRLGNRVMLVGSLAPLAGLVWLLGPARDAIGGDPITESVRWMPAIGMDLDFRLDGLGALMTLLIGGIGFLVFVYAWRYFGEQEGLGRFAAFLVGFAGAMFGVVVADNLLLLFVFWELTSITSYLLIGFDDDSAAARSGALQALLVTGLGGLAMMGGIVLVAQAAGTYSLAAIVASPPEGGVVGAGLGLILLGAFTKSAQFPFHFWLPGAMAAPTPVSAYLHSATMVKAGIYLVARLAPAFAAVIGWWRPTLITVGVVTMLVGGWRALAQDDLKLILAQGTVSQLGFIMLLVGMGVPEATFAGAAMILAHGIFKAALFMTAGIVDHQAHTRDIRRLSGVGRAMPALAGVAIVAAASMAGLPPLLGFVTKEAALEGLVHHGNWWATGGVVLGSVLTAAYGLRYLAGGFGTVPTDSQNLVGADAPPPSLSFLAAPLLLVLLTVAGGLATGLFDGLVGAAAESSMAGAGAEHLALWHGLGTPLLLSAIALGGGFWIWRRPIVRLRRITERLPEASRVYGDTVAGLNDFADRVTSVVQSGSLPIYLGVIVTTAILGPSIVMAGEWALPERLILAESPLQAVTAALVITAAIGTALVKRRLGAVLFLGAVGYGVAVLFVIQGAPDLALTQLLIETLTLALFVLLLRHLPARFEGVGWRLGRFSRIAVAVGVGLSAGFFSLWAAGGRVATPLTGEFLTRAEPEGGGRNIVNVILTDFRAFDTLGEITVLTVAALGAIMLIRTRRPRDDDAESARSVEEMDS